METYGINKIHYSMATLGEKLNITLKFNLPLDSNAQFMLYVDSVPNVRGSSNLAQALKESPSIFSEKNGGRPNAKKILVVVIDSKSSGSEKDIEDAVNVVEEANIRVIPVGIDQADRTELLATTLVEGDVLTPAGDENPEEIAEDIMDRALNGKRIKLEENRARFVLRLISANPGLLYLINNCISLKVNCSCCLSTSGSRRNILSSM